MVTVLVLLAAGLRIADMEVRSSGTVRRQADRVGVILMRTGTTQEEQIACKPLPGPGVAGWRDSLSEARQTHERGKTNTKPTLSGTTLTGQCSTRLGMLRVGTNLEALPAMISRPPTWTPKQYEALPEGQSCPPPPSNQEMPSRATCKTRPVQREI